MSIVGTCQPRPQTRLVLPRAIALLLTLSLVAMLPTVAGAQSQSFEADRSVHGFPASVSSDRVVVEADPSRNATTPGEIEAVLDEEGLDPEAVGVPESAAELLKEVEDSSGTVPVMVVARTDPAPAVVSHQGNQSRDSQGRIDEVLDELAASDAEVLKVAEALPVVTAEVDAAALDSLINSPAVEGIQRVVEVQSHIDETTALTGLDDMQAMGVTGAANLGLPRWDIAVIDSGIRRSHLLVAGRVASEWCFRFDATCPNGQTTDSGVGAANTGTNFHGNHVAATAMGNYDNTFTGAAPGSQVHAIKVLDEAGGGSTDDILAALDKVHELVTVGNQRIAAVNLSLGTTDGYSSVAACEADNPAFVVAIDQLRAAGVLVVASAGNAGTPEAIGAPACLSDVLSVGNTTDADAVHPTSSAAQFLDIWAPGTNVQSAGVSSDRSLASSTGTSMSAPHVTGAAALLYSCSALNSAGAPGASPLRDDLVAALLTDFGPDVTDARPRVNSGPVTKKRLDMRAIADALNANNAWADPVNLGGLSGQINDTNSCATLESGEPSHLGESRSSVWFEHTAQETNILVLSLCDSATSFDSNITVFTGATVAGLSQVGGNDDGCGETASLSQVMMRVTQGVTYQIAVSADSYGAPFLLQWSYTDGALCNNQLATWVGTAGDDTFTGGPGVDVIVAGPGNDVIDGGGGDDVICLGPGNDIGRGGDGDDQIFGGDGLDSIYAGPGDDYGHGGVGNDRLFGGPDNDQLFGAAGVDLMNGDIGNDDLYGGSGADRLFGSHGNDRIWGGEGDDDIRANFGADQVWGDGGDDALNGGVGNDLVVGGAGHDRIWGGEGVDDLRGANGWDRILGGPGADSVNGGNGNDYLAGEAGNDTIIGWQGDDNLRGAGGQDTLNGGTNNDYCHGGDGSDSRSACEEFAGFP